MTTQEDAIKAASHLIRTVQTIYYAGTSLGDQSVFHKQFKDAVRDLPGYLQEAEDRIKPMLPAIHKMTKGSGNRTIGQFSECTACDLALKLGEDTSQMVDVARRPRRTSGPQNTSLIEMIVTLKNMTSEPTIIKDRNLAPIRKIPSRSEFDSLLARVKRELIDVQEISPASGDSKPTQAAIESTRKNEILENMQPSVRNAYSSYDLVERNAGRRLTDKDAYDWLFENGIPSDRGELGELEDYDLPCFEAWARYLRKARKQLGEQKNSPRAGRKTGKSVVHQDQV